MLILSSDYDDTLYVREKYNNSDKEFEYANANNYEMSSYDEKSVKEDDIKAIQKFQEMGNIFIINTGRHLDSIFEECDKYGLKPDFYIGNNGNVIADKSRKIIYLAEFSNKLAKDIVKYFDENYSEYFYYISVNDGYNFGAKIYNDGSRFIEGHQGKLEDYIDKPISTMFSQLIIEKINPNDAQEILNELNTKFLGRAKFFLNYPYIDMVEKINDKGTAIDKVLEITNISPDLVYTIGDNHNDISMLQKYNGYAMNHADEKVKSYVKGNTVSSVKSLIEKIVP